MLVKVKIFLKKHIGEGFYSIFVRILISLGINNKYILFTKKKAIPKRVNLNYCHDFLNLGDNISPVIVEHIAKKKNINLTKELDSTKHLYAIGSIITAGAQDCTVWGSGLLNTRILGRLQNRKIDLRAVRGPLTRIIMMDQGFSVPEVYGDPAIIMPEIYNPNVEKKYPVSVITHTNEKTMLPDENIHIINIVTDDYKEFVNEIKSSELVISSSLHGIIFAEVYGVPAIMLKPKTDLLKYFDYYYSTKRYQFPIAETVEEALKMKPLSLPDFTKMRKDLIDVFPIDLFE